MTSTDAFVGNDEDTVESALDEPWHLLEDARNNRATSRRQLVKLLEQLGVSDRRVREDYEGRFAIELLQNAHDACHDDGTVGRAWFVLTDSALLVGNQGHPFDGPRIAALTRLGASTKDTHNEQRHVIGYKGIGFSSVFSITTRPQVSSDGILFGFDRDRANEAVKEHLGRGVKDLAVRCFPFRLDPSAFEDDYEAVQDLHQQGAVTVIRLPIDRKAVDDVRTALGSSITGEALLFMPHLDGLTLIDQESTRSWTRSPGKEIGRGAVVHLVEDGGGRTSWLVAAKTVEAPPEARTLEDDIWKSVRWLNVSVALPWKGQSVDGDRGPQQLRVYFPTDDSLGRSLLVHGDFFLHSSRRYIQDQGDGGRVSLAVAEGAAALTAELAESVAARGGLLDALAYSGSPSGFGQRLNGLIDDRLSDAAIVRSHTRGEVRQARDLSILETSLESNDDHRRLFDALRDPHTLVAFDDDQGPASELLKTLGVDVLIPTEVAERVSMPKVRGTYDDALGLLKGWYESLPNTHRTLVRRRLRMNPTVRDAQGKWRPGPEVRRYVASLPTPPLRMRPPRLKAPTGFELNAFVNNVLGVEQLTPASLFRDVLEAVSRGETASTASECRKTLRFLLELRRNHSDAFDASDERLQTIPVPVRTLKDPSSARVRWEPARHAYFRGEVVGDSLVEQLYGRFNTPEFLDVGSSGCAGDDVPAFFAILGVKAAPRMVEFTFDEHEPPTQLHRDLLREWLASEQASPIRCGSHPRTARKVTIGLVDRLDHMLGSPTAERSAVLARVLSRVEQPFGPSADIRCSAYRCHFHMSIAGYQQWLMVARPWLPCQEDDRVRLRPPGQAWFGIPRNGAHLLPAVALDDEAAEVLGCVSFNRPSVDAVETALRSLNRRFSDLEAAPPEAKLTIDVLMDRLELVLEDSSTPRSRVPLPSRTAGRRTWATRPLVADVPHADRLDNVTLLTHGTWPRIKYAYELQAASQVVHYEIQVQADDGAEPLLDEDTRAELVALLTRKSDRGAMARLVGRLQEEPVAQVHLDLRHGSSHARTDLLPYHLHIEQEPDSERSRRGTLFTTPQTSDHLYLLAGALADYLGAPHHHDLIHSYFTAPTHVLANNHIDAARIAEARDALTTFPLDGHQPRNVVRDLNDLVPVPLPPSATDDDADSEPDVGSDGAGDLPDFSDPWPQDPTTSATNKRTRTATGNKRRSTEADTGAGAGSVPAETHWSEHAEGAIDFEEATPLPAPFGSTTPPRPNPQLAPNPSDGPAAPTREEVDQRAIRIATGYGQSLGATVKRVDHERRGWDLEFSFGEETWLIEVKGMAQESKGFIVTRNELRAAATEPNYRFIVVTGVKSSGGRLTVLQPTAEQLDPVGLEPVSWRVTPWRLWNLVNENKWSLPIDSKDPQQLTTSSDEWPGD